jgi:peptide/nickel transport system substrate-binding protein
MSLPAENCRDWLSAVGLATVLPSALLFWTGCTKEVSLDERSGSPGSTQESTKQEHRVTPFEIDPLVLIERRFSEAPMLSARVIAGDLPPVSERLPDRPLVIRPIESIGRYGGTLHRALTGDIVQRIGISKTLGENLMGWERPMPDSIQPNLVESYGFKNDGRVAIFRLRRGLKWSDGHPFTVADILFYLLDIQQNPDAANTVASSDWVVDGERVKMERVDDQTLRMSSSKPLGRALEILCGDRIAVPRHFFSQLHPRYNPEATYEDLRRATTPANLIMEPGVPQLSAWIPVKWHHGQRLEYERNPYYWKVDTAGNQLPYADRLVFQVVPDGQMILLKFLNGELDLYGRYSNLDAFGVLKSAERKGKLITRLAGPSRSPCFYLNWDAPRPALRKAFREKNVRIALSHAINRDEVNAVAFHGLLEPAGHSFGPESPYFSKEAQRYYSTFEPKLSRQLLDDTGYRDNDGDGYRELSDGSRFALTIDVVPSAANGFNGVKICELVSEYWEDIGIKVNLNVALRDILFPRRNNGDFDVHFWSSIWPNHSKYWAALEPNTPFWHRNANQEGPEWLHQVTRLMKETAITVDPAVLREKMGRILKLHAENVPIISIGPAYYVWGVNKRLGNVPEDIVIEDAYRGWSRPLYHEQIFIKW